MMVGNRRGVLFFLFFTLDLDFGWVYMGYHDTYRSRALHCRILP
jgi:hypothetical protein